MKNEGISSSKKHSVLPSLVRISVSFVLCLLVSVLLVCLSVWTALTSEFTIDKIKNSNYVDHAVDEMTQDLNDLAIPAGLPDNFFNQKISKNDFEELLISKITAKIEGKDFTADAYPIKLSIEKQVEDYIVTTLGTNEMVWDDALSQFTNECYTVYLQYLSPSLFDLAFSAFSEISAILMIAIIIIGVIVLGLLVFLFKLCALKDFFKYGFIIFSGAGLICGSVPLYLLITDELSRMGVTAKSLYNFLYTFASDFLALLVIFAIALLIISAILLTVEIIITYKVSKSKQQSKNT